MDETTPPAMSKTLARKGWRRGGAGLGLLALALAFLGLMGLGAFTPLAWIAMGRPGDTYPEWLFLLYGMPAALALMLVAAIRAWALQRRARRHAGVMPPIAQPQAPTGDDP